MIPVPSPPAEAAEHHPVVEIRCVRPVTFATPHPWIFSAERDPVTAATALVIRADPQLLVPRDVGQRVLYVEGWPVDILSVADDLALVVAPLALSGPIRAWFGEDTLPERVDAEARRRAVDAMAALPPLAPLRVDSGIVVTGRKVLIAQLGEWSRTCGE